MRIHHIGFEVRSLKLMRLILENELGFHAEQYMEMDGERILFLVNGPVRVELIENGGIEENGLYQPHICFETDCLPFLNGEKVTIMEGPIRMENGWISIFIKGETGETIEFLKRT